MKSLVETRNMIKKKKPKFIRKDAHKKIKIGTKWRRPKGLHNKMKKGFRGKGLKLEVGYKSPKDVCGTNRNGIKNIEISNIKELENIDTKKEGIVIKRSVGLKNKIMIIKKAIEKGINILNIKNPQEVLNKEKKPKEKDKAKKEKPKSKEETDTKKQEENKKEAKKENETK